MDKICAIVDTQGFQLKDRFIPREVAVVSDYISQCQELDPCIEWNTLTKDEQETIIYSTQFKHGLFYRPFNPIITVLYINQKILAMFYKFGMI